MLFSDKNKLSDYDETNEMRSNKKKRTGKPEYLTPADNFPISISRLTAYVDQVILYS
jgi:hypothetical protein